MDYRDQIIKEIENNNFFDWVCKNGHDLGKQDLIVLVKDWNI